MPRLRPRGRRRSVRTYRGRYKTARLRRTPAGFTTPPLMAVDFAASCPLVRLGRPRYPVRVPRVAALLHASFGPRLAATPLRFANPSPPSGWVEDFHLQAVEHARPTVMASAAFERLTVYASDAARGESGQRGAGLAVVATPVVSAPPRAGLGGGSGGMRW